VFWVTELADLGTLATLAGLAELAELWHPVMAARVNVMAPTSAAVTNSEVRGYIFDLLH
jgi:hypothetical protein